MNLNPQFADGVGTITLTEGIVRIDLVELRIDANNTPLPERSGTLAMPLTGFLRAVDQLNQSVNRLVEQGVLTRNAPTVPAAPATSATPAAASKTTTIQS